MRTRQRERGQAGGQLMTPERGRGAGFAGGLDDAEAGAAERGVNAEDDLMGVERAVKGGVQQGCGGTVGAAETVLHLFELLEADAHGGILHERRGWFKVEIQGAGAWGMDGKNSRRSEFGGDGPGCVGEAAPTGGVEIGEEDFAKRGVVGSKGGPVTPGEWSQRRSGEPPSMRWKEAP